MFCCITLAVLISRKYITGIYRMVIILRKISWDKQEKGLREIEEDIEELMVLSLSQSLPPLFFAVSASPAFRYPYLVTAPGEGQVMVF